MNVPKFCHSVCFIAVLFLLVPTFAHGQKNLREAKILINANFEPASTVGMLIAPGATIQKLNTKVESDSTGNLIVTFPYNKSEVEKGMVATAMAISEAGEIAFGRTVSLGGKRGGISATVKLPECQDKLPKGAVIQGQHALLEKLVEVRSKRRNYYRFKLKEILTDSFLARLSKIESGLGISEDEELDIGMNPVLLSKRLSALKLAISSYEAHKEHKKSRGEQAPAPSE